MGNRRFEMYQHRQIIQRLRLGESDRAIGRAEQVGRVKVAALRELAAQRGWLDPAVSSDNYKCRWRQLDLPVERV